MSHVFFEKMGFFATSNLFSRCITQTCDVWIIEGGPEKGEI